MTGGSDQWPAGTTAQPIGLPPRAEKTHCFDLFLLFINCGDRDRTELAHVFGPFGHHHLGKKRSILLNPGRVVPLGAVSPPKLLRLLIQVIKISWTLYLAQKYPQRFLSLELSSSEANSLTRSGLARFWESPFRLPASSIYKWKLSGNWAPKQGNVQTAKFVLLFSARTPSSSDLLHHELKANRQGEDAQLSHCLQVLLFLFFFFPPLLFDFTHTSLKSPDSLFTALKQVTFLGGSCFCV